MKSRHDPLNLLESARPSPDGERVDVLASGTGFRLERIVSLGQATEPGEWYDQDRSEWVMLVAGAARLRFEDQPSDLALAPGDAVLIDAHRRHRVTWTDPAHPTVWLALHFDAS